MGVTRVNPATHFDVSRYDGEIHSLSDRPLTNVTLRHSLTGKHAKKKVSSIDLDRLSIRCERLQ